MSRTLPLPAPETQQPPPAPRPPFYSDPGFRALVVTIIALVGGIVLAVMRRDTMAGALIGYAVGGWTMPRPPGTPPGGLSALPPAAAIALLLLMGL